MRVANESIKHQAEHETVLMDYLDGSTQAPAVADALYLIDNCQRCQSLYKQCRRVETSLTDKRLFIRLLSEAPKQRRVWMLQPRWVFGVALLCLAAGLGISWRYRQVVGSQESEILRAREKVTELSGLLDQAERQAPDPQQGLAQGGPLYVNSVSHTLNFYNQRSAGGVEKIRLPAAAQGLHLILRFEDKQRHSRYRVSFSTSYERVLWVRDDLKKLEHDALQISIPRDFLLKNPELMARIYGLDKGPDMLLAEGRLQIGE